MLLLKTQQLSQDMNTFIDPVISDLHTGQVVTLTLQIEHITRWKHGNVRVSRSLFKQIRQFEKLSNNDGQFGKCLRCSIAGLSPSHQLWRLHPPITHWTRSPYPLYAKPCAASSKEEMYGLDQPEYVCNKSLKVGDIFPARSIRSLLNAPIQKTEPCSTTEDFELRHATGVAPYVSFPGCF
jgi:hypothetical protein